MIEKWKIIKDYPYYEASNLGRIKRIKTQKILKSGITKAKNPRPTVVLYKNGKEAKTVSVSRIILTTFKGKPNFEKAECNHKDGIRLHNEITNLEWVTSCGNIQHALKTGLRKNQAIGSRISKSKLKEKDIPTIRKMIAEGYKLEDIGNKFNVTKCTVFDIKHNKTWRHVS